LAGAFSAVVEVVVAELVVVGAVVVARVEVEVEVVRARFFGGATAWPLVVVWAVVAGEVGGAVVAVVGKVSVTVSVEVVAVTSVDVVSVVSRSDAFTVPPAAA
jgi:hypothetical protein